MQTINLSLGDNFIIISYFIILIYIGYRAFRLTNQNCEQDFLLANRSLSLPAFIATLVTTWYGGILGVGEFTYLYGISTWFAFGLPYYVFAVLFAFFLAGKVRRENQVTIADIFYTRYGKAVGVFASIFLLFMTSPAPYILMVAFLIQVIFNFSLLLSLVIGTAFSTIYVYYGGFRSVVLTDKFQFVLIYASFIILLIFLVFEFGDWKYLNQNLDSNLLMWHGGNSFQYIIVWFFLASWTFIDPGFHQRCAAAKNKSVARNGILLSVVFWFLFDFLTVSTGLYAAASFSDINPVLSYPLLADKVLPPLIKGLFFTGLLAVIMSTVDSFTLLSAITFGRDIVWRLKNETSNLKVNNYTKAGLIITAVISILLCLIMPSVIKLWYVIGSLFIPPMLLPLLTAYLKNSQLPGRQTLIIMITSFLVSLLSFIWGQVNIINEIPVYPFALEPFFPGMIVSFSFYFLYNFQKNLKKQ